MVISSFSYLSDSSSNIGSVSGSDSDSSHMAELKTYLQWNQILRGCIKRNIEEALHAHSEGTGRGRRLNRGHYDSSRLLCTHWAGTHCGSRSSELISASS